jgi:hypothetical protein
VPHEQLEAILRRIASADRHRLDDAEHRLRIQRSVRVVRRQREEVARDLGQARVVSRLRRVVGGLAQHRLCRHAAVTTVRRRLARASRPDQRFCGAARMAYLPRRVQQPPRVVRRTPELPGAQQRGDDAEARFELADAGAFARVRRQRICRREQRHRV